MDKQMKSISIRPNGKWVDFEWHYVFFHDCKPYKAIVKGRIAVENKQLKGMENSLVDCVGTLRATAIWQSARSKLPELLD